MKITAVYVILTVTILVLLIFSLDSYGVSPTVKRSQETVLINTCADFVREGREQEESNE